MLRWTGPLVPRATWRLMPHVRAVVTPFSESFLAVPDQGDVVRIVSESDPQYRDLVDQALAKGLEPPIGNIVHFHRETGLWWPSVSTSGWHVRAPFGSTLTESELVQVLRRAGMVTGPAREVRVTLWLIADVIGLVLLAVWIRKTLAWLLRWRSGRRALAGRCPSCGYDLTGLATSTCPECGMANTRDT